MEGNLLLYIASTPNFRCNAGECRYRSKQLKSVDFSTSDTLKSLLNKTNGILILIFQRFKSLKESSTELSFAQFNVPNGGDNLLGSLKYRNEELYSVGKPMEEVFWLHVDSAWFKIAEGLKVRDYTIFQQHSKIQAYA
jgi:hypothetical protein